MTARFRHIPILIFISCLCSCVFIQQIKENRKNDHKDSVQQIEQRKDTSDFTPLKEDAEDKLSIKNAPLPADTHQYIWYHPNPWWKIKTDPFPVSADSFQYRMMRPQYGFPEFIHPDLSKDFKTWNIWLTANKMYDDVYFGGHIWQGLIQNQKELLMKHPEYLAEINGERVGFGKTNKFCVSNPDVYEVVYESLKSVLNKNPNRKFVSIEPSDGSLFCQCKGCQKMGSISNQVFFLANQIAQKFEKAYPEKMLNLYAYNLHSDTPSFKLNKNITVAVIPGGFQTIYPLNTMLTIWGKHHNNLFWRDYFGIPQWTSDLPRIDVEDFLTRTEIARSEGYQAVVMESGMNLNAALLYVLFNAKWMNDNLNWNFIFNKFISDCFPSAKEPMERLFRRWHHSWLQKDEFRYAAYDLNEALKLVKDSSESERIVDIIAYSRMIFLLYQWLENRSDIEKLEQYLIYICRLSTRNLVHPRAILTAYQKHLPGDELKQKYSFESFKNQKFRYLSKEEIISSFKTDLLHINPERNDFLPLPMQQLSSLPYKSKHYSDYYTNYIQGRSGMYIVTGSPFTIRVISDEKSNDTNPAHITVNNYNNTRHFTRMMSNGDSWTIPLNEIEAFQIQVHRVRSVKIEIYGKFIPVFSEYPKNTAVGSEIYSYYYGWKKLEYGETIQHTNPYYFLLKD